MGCGCSKQMKIFDDFVSRTSKTAEGYRFSDLVQRSKKQLQMDQFFSSIKTQFEAIQIPVAAEYDSCKAELNGFMERFDNFYIDKNQQMELVQFLGKIIKTKLTKILAGDQQLYAQVVAKLEQLYQRVFKKNKLCVKVFKYTSKPKKYKQDQSVIVQTAQSWSDDSLKFDLSFQEVKAVAATSRQFCEMNMNAFSLLTLYFMHSLHKLYTQGRSFEQIQSLLQENLQKLQKIYPANKSDQANIPQSQTSLDLSKYKFIEKTQTITFNNFYKSHYEQLVDYILQKSDKADSEEENFIELAKSICLEKGYGFKTGTKIATNRSVSSIERTIQKLLSTQKFQSVLNQWKRVNIGMGCQAIETKKGLKSYVDSQKQAITTKVKEILENQTSLQFTTKDLLRGKCMFEKPEDVVDTLQKLAQKVYELKYSIHEVKDRLNKKTRDITVIINMKKVRAQLQLCLKFDKIDNEFNHRIYELMRSVKFTSITNLQILNEMWGSQFFGSQLEVFERLLYKSQKQETDLGEGVNVGGLKDDVKNFVEKYLKSEYLGLDLESFKEASVVKRLASRSINKLRRVVEKMVVPV